MASLYDLNYTLQMARCALLQKKSSILSDLGSEPYLINDKKQTPQGYLLFYGLSEMSAVEHLDFS